MNSRYKAIGRLLIEDYGLIDGDLVNLSGLQDLTGLVYMAEVKSQMFFHFGIRDASILIKDSKVLVGYTNKIYFYDIKKP